MNLKQLLTLTLTLFGFAAWAQNGWTIANAPYPTGRTDDVFMVGS